MFIKIIQRTIIRLLLNTYIFPPTQTCGMTLSVSPVNTCMGVPSHAVSSPQFFSSDPIFISFREPRSLEESSNGPTTTWIYMDISCAFFTSQLHKVVLITRGGGGRGLSCLIKWNMHVLWKRDFNILKIPYPCFPTGYCFFDKFYPLVYWYTMYMQFTH